jgi:hypothetical protein
MDGEAGLAGTGSCEGRCCGAERGVVAELERWLGRGTEGLFPCCGEELIEERDERSCKGWLLREKERKKI